MDKYLYVSREGKLVNKNESIVKEKTSAVWNALQLQLSVDAHEVIMRITTTTLR